MNNENLKPKEIVKKLDRYIISQDNAKKIVSIAIRNRWRRQQLSEELRNEVAPKNIIMIGPTGVGKTEIARRLSGLTGAPFLKVEATKFTEIGYVGRSVDSMIRDLLEIAVSMVKEEKMKDVEKKAVKFAEQRILKLLLPGKYKAESETAPVIPEDTSEKLRALYRKGKLDDRIIEIHVETSGMPMMQIFSSAGDMEEMGINIKDMFKNMFPTKSRRKKLKIKEVKKIFIQEEIDKLIDMDEIITIAKEIAQNSGIIFIDEMDKIAGNYRTSSGPDISREGVQRDLLPIVEGSSVATKYGLVKTDHILFISAGAFNVSKPSDLIPELQGRFPLRVELKKLNSEDFRKILVEPQNALIKQYVELLKTEGVILEFTDDAIQEIALTAERVNEETENIGARRLHTIIEKLMEDISFNAPDMKGQHVIIDKEFVINNLEEILKSDDLKKYIL